jgi:predicted RecA/RadA family phage recombinase
MSVEKLSPSGSETIVVIAHTSAVASKIPQLINSRVVVPLDAYDANESGPYLAVDPDLEVPKATGAAWGAMDKIYWDDTAKNFTTTSTNNTYAGYAKRAAASGDDTGRLVLNPNTLT